MSTPTDIDSPCVRNCCLDDKDICLGCFRHLDEITGWHGLSDSQKKQVLALAANRKSRYKQFIPFYPVNRRR